ncbi:FAD-dependent oxidoreductase [Mangrovihabitans endophyticus]|uniref:3-ketosteroid-delta-1-dehydrogenase n=1 Tax=Mangrovihabitans endophyticus TaxID=1751298 RepID=A0A8J3C3F4_9ACTN|nr:FAD-dependent oxidoreductase [Mangrovihabitans endophyticus]GGL09387.1 3-ketosteroid-delta-1-dehydrogenase [Mangrovihabitans endophyticus]
MVSAEPDPCGGAARTTDVLVAGSGAAGLAAALTAAVLGRRVVVVERCASIGGTSALSGGRVWVPGNRFQDDPVSDRAAARRYLAGIFDPGRAEMTEAFLTSAPEMADFVEAHTPHVFVPCPGYPDYHPGRSGATLGGRCLDMEPLSLRSVTPVADLIRMPPGYLPLRHAEWERWRQPHRYDRSLLERRRLDRTVTGGVALVAALLDGALRAGAGVRTGLRLSELSRDGARWAATVEQAGETRVIRAEHVVLATGGFDQDPGLRRRYLPPGVEVSTAAPGNTGDALGLCVAAGARLENLEQGWWTPALSIPGEHLDGVPFHRALIRERGVPRMIVVDRTGNRFADEAAPYHRFGKALQDRGPGACLVFDEGFRRRYAIPGMAAGDPVPSWVTTGDTAEALARRLGVDPAGLAAQIGRWNQSCARGVDDEFARGDDPYDRYYGDPDQPGNPSLGPLDEPPLHGVPIRAATMGSKGGPVTDADARVLGEGGIPVPGLYAVGNAAAFWTAAGYPGPGATLGVAMALGYRAGRATAS